MQQSEFQVHNAHGVYKSVYCVPLRDPHAAQQKETKQSPAVDAGDVQKLMLLLQYVLDGLADEAIAEHQASSCASVPDP